MTGVRTLGPLCGLWIARLPPAAPGSRGETEPTFKDPFWNWFPSTLAPLAVDETNPNSHLRCAQPCEVRSPPCVDGMQAARQDHRRLNPSRAPSFRPAAGEAPAPAVSDVCGAARRPRGAQGFAPPAGAPGQASPTDMSGAGTELRAPPCPPAPRGGRPGATRPGSAPDGSAAGTDTWTWAALPGGWAGRERPRTRCARAVPARCSRPRTRPAGTRRRTPSGPGGAACVGRWSGEGAGVLGRDSSRRRHLCSS